MSQEISIFKKHSESTLSKWREKEQYALELLRIVGKLRFERGIELVLFRRDIYDSRPSTVIKNHKYISNYSKRRLEIEDSLTLAKSIARMKHLAPCRIDIGALGLNWVGDNTIVDIEEFVRRELGKYDEATPKNQDRKDIVLYGFGRIGRLVARRIIAQTGKGDQLRLRAIVVRPKMDSPYEETQKRVALLATDSIHGDFQGPIDISEDGSQLMINGNTIQMIYANAPEEIDYTAFGIDKALLIDNTGVWRTKNELSKHLRPGIAQILLTAPGKGEMPNVVYGVNERDYNFDQENILSAASCTTNAIAPVLKVLDDELGIVKGHVESIHSYTNDQNLIDNFHKKTRRGRGAPINMVLTTTGAAGAVSKVLPRLSGKLTGNAIRVPTPNVSLAVLNLTFEKEVCLRDLDVILKKASFHGDLVEQIGYSSDLEFVSSSAVGTTTALIIDAPSTIISADGRSAVVYLWYDNEYGYTCQVVRLAKHVAKVRRYVYY